MATKRLHELDFKDAGVKARLAEMDGAFGGLSFCHERLNDGGHVLVVAQMYDRRQNEEAQREPPSGHGETLDAAGASLVNNFERWSVHGREVLVLEEGTCETRRYLIERPNAETVRVVRVRVCKRVGSPFGFSRDPWDEFAGR